jgi:hypothetical protein
LLELGGLNGALVLELMVVGIQEYDGGLKRAIDDSEGCLKAVAGAAVGCLLDSGSTAATTVVIGTRAPSLFSSCRLSKSSSKRDRDPPLPTSFSPTFLTETSLVAVYSLCSASSLLMLAVAGDEALDRAADCDCSFPATPDAFAAIEKVISANGFLCAAVDLEWSLASLLSPSYYHRRKY